MDIKTIKHISSLARIGLSKTEEEMMKNELSSVLEYVEKLEQVDTEGVEPLYQTTGMVNSLREDEPVSGREMSEDLNNKLIGQAPAKEKRFIKVKSVFNK